MDQVDDESVKPLSSEVDVSPGLEVEATGSPVGTDPVNSFSGPRVEKIGFPVDMDKVEGE